jgi:hypothetical protein
MTAADRDAVPVREVRPEEEFARAEAAVFAGAGSVSCPDSVVLGVS